MKSSLFRIGLAGVLIAGLSACSETASDKSGTMDASRAISPAESNCLAAVANEVGNGDVTTLRVEESEAAIGVYVNVPGAEAPWLCLANRDGSVSEVRYTGSEGKL